MTKNIKIILMTSIVLNLALVGTVAGMAYKNWDMRRPPIPADLTQESQSLVRKTFEAGRADVRPMIEHLKSGRKTLQSVLFAPTFDRAAYQSAMDQYLDAKNDMAHKRGKVMGDILEQLPPQDREKFAAHVMKTLKWDRPRASGNGPSRKGGPDLEKPSEHRRPE